MCVCLITAVAVVFKDGAARSHHSNMATSLLRIGRMGSLKVNTFCVCVYNVCGFALLVVVVVVF